MYFKPVARAVIPYPDVVINVAQGTDFGMISNNRIIAYVAEMPNLHTLS
jgi:hypothetical protein